jgi:hypothetical protein
VAGAELVEGTALEHRQIAAGLAVGGPPVGAAGQRHVGRIAGEIEAVDGPAHHLLFPVIVQIRQQRGARAAHGGMDIAVDPRGGHGLSLTDVSWISFLAAQLRRGPNVPPTGRERKGKLGHEPPGTNRTNVRTTPGSALPFRALPSKPSRHAKFFRCLGRNCGLGCGGKAGGTDAPCRVGPRLQKT